MKLSSIFREARQNVEAGVTRAVFLAVVSATILSLFIAIDFLAVREMLAQANDFQRSGASVFTIAAPKQIDGDLCDSLNDLANVDAAGAVRNVAGELSVLSAPGSPIPLVEVTPGALQVLGVPQDSSRGWAVSESVAKAFNIRGGDQLSTSQGEVQVSAVFQYPEDGRKSGYGFSALYVNPERRVFDECWVKVWPVAGEIIEFLPLAMSPDSSSVPDVQPVISQLNTTKGTKAPGLDDFSMRPSRFGLVIAPFAVGVVAFIAIRRRKLQIASDLHAGVPKRAILLWLLVETMCWSVLAGVLLLPLSVLLAAISCPSALQSTAVFAGKLATAAVITAGIGAMLAGSSVRESDLFRYFKQRD